MLVRHSVNRKADQEGEERNVLLESAACGRPIITTDRSGCKEIVENRFNGYRVGCKNIKELLEVEKEFVELSYIEKKQMGLNGRSKVQREFDRAIVINKYFKIMEIERNERV